MDSLKSKLKSIFEATLVCTLSLVAVVAAKPAFAEFSVEDKSWPKQLPESEHGYHNYYGNSVDQKFYRAQNPEEMSQAERAEIKRIVPETEYYRWYLKAGAFKNALEVTSVKNKAKASQSALAGAAINSKRAKASKNSFIVGVGYDYKTWRIDFEYNVTKQKLNYNKAPVFKNINVDLTSKVENKSLIANFYNDFKEIYGLKPFVGLSAGLSLNRTESVFVLDGINDTDNSKVTLAPALGGQLGVKTRLFKTNAFLSASYRYLYLGKVKWIDSNNNMKLKGSLFSKGLGLDLIYVL